MNSISRKAAIFTIVLISLSSSLAAQQVETGTTRLVAPANSDRTGETIDANERIDRLITALVLDNIPHTYTDDKKWGMQDERWDGLHIRRDGWKIRTKRRKKMVNDGRWRKYTAQLLNPDQEFAVDVNNLRQLENGKVGFDVNFAAHLAIHARQSQWVKGVQLYSLSADGTAKVRLAIRCELDIDLDFNNLPPDVILSPEIVQADLAVDEFRLDRISKVGGEVSQQVAKATRSILDKKIEEKEDKLVRKINQQIEKKKDELRLSLSEAIDSKWTEKALPVLPKPVVEAIQANQDK